MMATAAAESWAPYIAGGAGLLGVFVGGVITFFADRRSWIRAERMRVYSDFLSSSQQVENALTDITLRAHHVVGPDAPAAVSDAMDAVQLDVERVRLVGSPTVRDAVNEFRKTTRPLSGASKPFIETDEDIPEDDARRTQYRAAISHYLRARAELIVQMRDDLA